MATVLAAALLAASAARADGGDGGRVSARAASGGLSLHAEQASPDEVLRAVADAAAIEVRGAPQGGGAITDDFDALSFDAAFRRLLGEQSFLLIYGADGKPKAVELLGADATSRTARQASAGEGNRPSDGSPPAASTDAPPMPGSLRPHPISGRLAGALRSGAASFNQVVEIAAQTDDPTLRREALAAAMQILDAEPELHGAVLGTVQRVGADQLARYLRYAAGPRAEALAGALVDLMKTDAARTRALAVARQLQTTVKR